MITAKKSRAKSKRASKPGKDDAAFSGFAAGPGKPSRATRALGKTRAPVNKIDTTKKAADFVAEGVVDDVDDIVGDVDIAGLVDDGFAPEDIRFGIDDVEDPFLREENSAEEPVESEEIVGVDVTGDGGVLKTVLENGSGDVANTGSKVRVVYVGRNSGEVFDSSDDSGFEFTLGKGDVIKGWEAGVATMKKGEKAILTILPGYAYGRRGMPPVIPANATLEFEITLKDFVGRKDEDIKRVAEFNPTVARTPDEIDAEYRERLKTREERRKNMSLLERFYIISPFASQTGEKPPWWINPNITFVTIMLGVAAGAYLVYLSGAVHIGYVDKPVDVNIFK